MIKIIKQICEREKIKPKFDEQKNIFFLELSESFDIIKSKFLELANQKIYDYSTLLNNLIPRDYPTYFIIFFFF